MLEEQGVTYRTQTGDSAPLEKILIAGGTNIVRLRLWVNPYEGKYRFFCIENENLSNKDQQKPTTT
jgi:arabinogalactan endo-1,4-beta-galactosidase